MKYAVGIGYDIHSLEAGGRLVIGGVEIPYEKGLRGHSDADVLLHAVCDALLGAVAEPDIGEQFPDTDARLRGIDSRELLHKVYQVVTTKGFCIQNIDTVVIAQEPSLAPFKKQIRQQIAGILGIEDSRVGVKAKTNEHMGEIGRKEAIAAYAVVLVSKGVEQ